MSDLATRRALRVNLSIIIGLFLAILFVAVLSSCGSDSTDPTGDKDLTVGTCEGCHQDEAMLKANADPDDSEPPEDSGEG